MKMRKDKVAVLDGALRCITHLKQQVISLHSQLHGIPASQQPAAADIPPPPPETMASGTGLPSGKLLPGAAIQHVFD